MKEHPVLQANVKKLDEIFRQHPSLVSPADQKRVGAWRKKKAHAKLLRQLKACKANLAEFAGSVDNQKARATLANAVDCLGDSVWILGDASQ